MIFFIILLYWTATTQESKYEYKYNNIIRYCFITVRKYKILCCINNNVTTTTIIHVRTSLAENREDEMAVSVGLFESPVPRLHLTGTNQARFSGMIAHTQHRRVLHL